MDAFIRKGFHTVGTLKTNRMMYPCGMKQKNGRVALHLWKTDAAIPKEHFLNPKASRAFIYTDTSLSTMEIWNRYAERWAIEVFFRQCKNVLAFDRYRLRFSQEIHRYWLLMSLAYFLCCSYNGRKNPFEDEYSFFQKQLQKERVEYVYQCGEKHIPLEKVLSLVG